MKLFRTISTVVAITLAATACDSIDDDRIPIMPVQIQFQSVAVWDVYGVPGALSYRYFVKTNREPSNYPYTALSATGYGGVLLCGDISGQPVAYDMSCPVECRQDVRIRINDDDLVAECPVCHSTYGVFDVNGYPLSGEAAEQGWGLRRYRVVSGSGTDYRLITN